MNWVPIRTFLESRGFAIEIHPDFDLEKDEPLHYHKLVKAFFATDEDETVVPLFQMSKDGLRGGVFLHAHNHLHMDGKDEVLWFHWCAGDYKDEEDFVWGVKNSELHEKLDWDCIKGLYLELCRAEWDDAITYTE